MILTPIALFGVPAYIGFRLWRDSPARAEKLARAETELLYNHALDGHVTLSEADIDRALSKHWPTSTPSALKVQLLQHGRAIYASEGLSPEIPPPPALCNTLEGGRYRDQLARLGQVRHDRGMAKAALDMISRSLAPIAQAAPPLDGDVLVEITQFLDPLGASVEAVVAPFFEDNSYPLFRSIQAQLNDNLQSTTRSGNPIFPRHHKGEDVLQTYLNGTPLLELFSLRTPFTIPDQRRFEHLHMVAGSGHGKTQTLQYLIVQDLPHIASGDRSAVVIDSQGDLIKTILKHSGLPPERIVLIDPEDIEWPVSLNLFSAGQERLAGYNTLERERLTNSIIELYDFVLGSLLGAGMTSKQSVVFRYVTRLMFHIDGASIHTLRDLLEPKGTAQFQDEISQLGGSTKRFFETEFDGKEFASTKSQVLRRLYGVLENQTFERMFSNPKTKFDMFAEMNAGKLILINTAKSLLKEQGTQIFGRFFIALIAQAAQERATLKDSDRLPVHVYIDEAQDYFDETLSVILSQARKYRVGMTMAHQYLGQLTHGLQEAFEANTSIKMAGGVSARDARTLSGTMSCAPDLITSLSKGTFATSIRGVTNRAVPLSFPFFVLESRERADAQMLADIREYSRNAYAAPWEPKGSDVSPREDEGAEKDEEKPDDDPLKPSTEL
ncbi:type IV secretory system conjugative DNA transfer family protein [Gymnodinialimonas ceratoperidinii]|uniref:Type IV secretory system conjugative DNA transfer family protein n=1 Tax=Gymnodinialimonas ceratoperidinii TaxID=2856823 RepID=A0A8F6TYS5_9RHOB|nr:type IV secretory system conjugative DNA transfer family protein [Gymnodinialimonas ceratoperidinii]QXT41150.1 type IV secretory system conjugative DNA transfer family protein [Gymnodinialimonas ceratoperidinii]